ncbi:RNA-dependent RNA polymerase 1 [Cladorrhinum sp. PSN259]|nr:RNA-dependent RNA polymerase 1 [Cladorrhinum sp. PSN259]
MEVFLRNLEPDLTEKALANHLSPVLEKFGIIDYICNKQKRRFTGSITFLNLSDAQRFLDDHGEVPDPVAASKFNGNQFGRNGRSKMREPTKPRLFLMGRPCYCVKSNRPVDQTALKAIRHERDERQKAREQHTQPVEKPAEPAITMQASELNCGYHTFLDGNFAFVSEWSTKQLCLIKFTKWNLILVFEHGDRDVEVRISYKTIIHLVWSDDGCFSVTLSSSPTFLRKKYTEIELLAMSLFSSDPQKLNPDASNRISAIDDDHQLVAPFCLVYQVRISSSDFIAKILKVKGNELFDVSRHATQFRNGIQTSFGPFDQANKKLKRRLDDYTTHQTLPFDLLFLLQALVQNGYLHPATVSALADKIAQLFSQAKVDGEKQPPISNDTFKKLFQWIGYPHPDGDPRNIDAEGILEYLLGQEETVKDRPAIESELFSPTGTRALIFRAVISPTRITFHGPEMEAKNRILRKFPNHTDYFLRVQFCDENGQDLFFNPKIALDEIHDRFKSVLNNGIPIAGRLYTFLGFSHSSLRARSVWMSAPFLFEESLKFSRNIIDDLGKFETILSPARRAARIGQAFSETPYSVPLNERGISVHEIHDVEYDGRTFSDGVGTISPGAAEAIYEVIPTSKGFPTCFQIRWAGAKGMLALDTRLSGNQLCIRPSMSKFESKDKQNLEICDLAWKSAPMVLNRQLIKILEDMGAPGHWFLELQERELERLRGVTLTVYNTAGFLKMEGYCQNVQLHKLLRQVDKTGLDYRTDSFIRSAIEAILLKDLRLLKNKSRIPVPQGVVLFGVMDETGFLGEGEVYVAHESPTQDLPQRGRVLVSRSPALHPGDIQFATNVPPPEDSPLRALKHCIVFSQRGSRDLPSQLSGGDLDGDIYHVVWDKEVVDRARTYEPAEYPPVKLFELDRPVDPSDMSDFFIEFMKTDRLGIIASRHAILADHHDEGTLHKDCLKLAELHSNAVDFSKSGLAVDMKDMPKGPKWKPDFLAIGSQITIHSRSQVTLDEYIADESIEDDDEADQGPRYRYYKSDRIIGQLFRAVDERKIWHESIRMTIPIGGPSFWQEFLQSITRDRVFALGEVNWRQRIRDAEMIRHAYNEAIYSTMVDCSDHPHRPLTELEVFVGFIINKSGFQNARQRDKSIKLKDEFDRISSWVIREMRNQNLENEVSKKGTLDALELCLACVHMGCDKEDSAPRPFDRGSSQNLVSFRIVAASALLRELNHLERLKRAQADGMGSTLTNGATQQSGSLTHELAQLNINTPPRAADNAVGVSVHGTEWFPMARPELKGSSIDSIASPASSGRFMKSVGNSAQGLSSHSENHAAGVGSPGRQQQQHPYLDAQVGAQAGYSNMYPQLFR